MTIYDPNIPQFPSSSLAVTQQPFLTNFQAIFNIFSKNHDFATGNHLFTQLLEQAIPLQTNLGEISVFSQNALNQTDQVYLRYQGNGQIFQYTNYQLYSISDQFIFTILPGRIIVYFGSFTSQSVFTLTPLPMIARNIISISFCPLVASATAAAGKPKVEILAAIDGIIPGIKVTSSLGTNQAPPPSYYLILANI
jgi:hypothetical protein